MSTGVLDKYKELQERAIAILHSAIRKEGILAYPGGSGPAENYTRIWSRDSIMAGLIGLEINDSKITEGLRRSLDTLKDHQTQEGIIPSNVSIGDPKHVSYGGTAGRVDATLWYIIGALQYIEYTQDDKFRKAHIWHIQKAMEVCTIWEINNKHLIYTPLSGNWADEYPIHGYTLYDNCLRLWGLELYASCVGGDQNIIEKAELVKNTLIANFHLASNNKGEKYHQLLYQREVEKNEKPYFVAGFNPSAYYTMFDAGGNGLALMLGLMTEEYYSGFIDYLESVFNNIGVSMMPAFWPVIVDGDMLHNDLMFNYAYNFKNHPHHFHNGGIWPIMNGWLAKGLASAGQHDTIDKMKEAYLKIAIKEDFQFSEYISSDKLQPGGKAPLCYSATGALMLINS